MKLFHLSSAPCQPQDVALWSLSLFTKPPAPLCQKKNQWNIPLLLTVNVWFYLFYFFFFKQTMLWKWNWICSTLAAVNTSLLACPPAEEHRSLLLRSWAAKLCFKWKHSSASKSASKAKPPQHQRCRQALTKMRVSLDIQIPVRFF